MRLKFWRGDPVEVQSADSRAESQSALNGPSGSPTSPLQRALEAAGWTPGTVIDKTIWRRLAPEAQDDLIASGWWPK